MATADTAPARHSLNMQENQQVTNVKRLSEAEIVTPEVMASLQFMSGKLILEAQKSENWDRAGGGFALASN